MDNMDNMYNTNDPNNHTKCRLAPIKKEIKSYTLDCMLCLEHNKVVCRCGWSFGYHYGTFSKGLKI